MPSLMKPSLEDFTFQRRGKVPAMSEACLMPGCGSKSSLGRADSYSLASQGVLERRGGSKRRMCSQCREKGREGRAALVRRLEQGGQLPVSGPGQGVPELLTLEESEGEGPGVHPEM